MATTTNFGWETPDDTDLVKDGALAMRTLGNSIDTSFVDLKGGTTGQVLSKASNTDLDFTWVAQDDSNAIQNAIIDAKGDLIVGTAADTPSRLAVGTDGHVLTADSTTASGLKWAAAPGGGKVLQVVYADYATETSITTDSAYSDTGGTITITPTLSSSKVLLLCSLSSGLFRSNNTGQGGTFRFMRGSTEIFKTQASANSTLFTRMGVGDGSQTIVFGLYAFNYLDSPATTSATTYKIQGKVLYTTNGGAIICQSEATKSVMLALEIGA